MKKYVLVIDQGTTSSRVLVVNKKGEIVYSDYIEINIKQLKKGEVLQNPKEILSSVKNLLTRTLSNGKFHASEISSIGITNQRETTVIWDKTTNEVISDAISWQAHHTSYLTDEWIKKGYNIY